MAGWFGRGSRALTEVQATGSRLGIFTLALTGVDDPFDPDPLWDRRYGGRAQIAEKGTGDAEFRLQAALDGCRNSTFERDEAGRFREENRVFTDVVMWIPEVNWRADSMRGDARIEAQQHALSGSHEEKFSRSLPADRAPRYTIMGDRELAADCVAFQFGFGVFVPGPEDVLEAEIGLALLLCVVAAASFARLHPERLPASMPQRDRILVWAQPELHPHSGSQVLEAMDRVGEGGWLGARPWFGPNEEVMTVPAVQDDFITTFFLNRFGGVAGLALLGLQLCYALLLFALAHSIEATTERLDFREQNAGRVAGLALFGLAWMHLVHWGIAWGNTLGLLPVMGQPMTWLSAGNSHLLGFALVTLALATSWVLRELEPRKEREAARSRRASPP